MIKGSTFWDNLTMNNMKDTIFNKINVLSYVDMPHSLYNSLQETAAKYPEKVAFYDNWERSYTYNAFLEMVDSMAAYLKKTFDVKKRTHVGILLHNSIEFCVSFFAVVKLGAVAIPFPSKYREPEIEQLINKADLSVLLYSETFEQWILDYKLEEVGLLKSENEETGYGFRHISFKGLHIDEGAGELEDEVIIMFTSGTTSQSKGVVLCNYNVMNAVVVYNRTLGITPEDKTIIPVPIYHITGLVALLGLFVYTGGTVYLYRRYDAKRILSCIRDNEITFMHGSPTVYGLMLDYKSLFPRLPSLRMLACGSSYMPKEKMKEIHKWIPNTKFQIVYGMTETSSPALIFPEDAPTSIYAGAAGKPIPGIEFKFLDEEKQELGCNEVGEIWIRGNVVTKGYYKMETDLFSKDNWLNTGDMGYYNEDGYVFIVDRKKDMINRGGEKIWCTDIEEELLRISDIKDAAVVGIPDDIYGETAAAIVVVKEGTTLTEKEIQDDLKKRVAKYKIPTKILFVSEIPKTAGMKVNKKLIKTMLKKGDFLC
jgi:fatty-acyl-CoA synthase/long-chain acyl-CoA synthetase